MRLVRDYYGSEFNRDGDLFGIFCGQMRGGNHYVHNCGWYNLRGEKIGWGDLSHDDMKRIAKELWVDEAFLILRERDSFWNFVEKPGMIGSMSKVNASEQNPGLEYVLEHLAYAILPSKVYRMDSYEEMPIGKGELRAMLAECERQSIVHLDLLVQASLGKRKCNGLSGIGANIHECEMSMTFCRDGGKGVYANCWIKDDKDHPFGLVISAKSMEAMVQEYLKAKGTIL